MSWQEWGWEEWLGLGLAAIGGHAACIALAIATRSWLIEYTKNRERQLRGMVKRCEVPR